MKLCPDPQLGDRKGWTWCGDCQAIKAPGHVHGDPLEDMTRAELLALVRVLTVDPGVRAGEFAQNALRGFKPRKPRAKR